MQLLAQTMIEIVSAGGGLIIDLDKQILSFDIMIQIAAAAGRSGALVTFKLGRQIFFSDALIQIAAAGRGRIIFDIS